MDPGPLCSFTYFSTSRTPVFESLALSISVNVQTRLEFAGTWKRWCGFHSAHFVYNTWFAISSLHKLAQERLYLRKFFFLHAFFWERLRDFRDHCKDFSLSLSPFLLLHNVRNTARIWGANWSVFCYTKLFIAVFFAGIRGWHFLRDEDMRVLDADVFLPSEHFSWCSWMMGIQHRRGWGVRGLDWVYII